MKKTQNPLPGHPRIIALNAPRKTRKRTASSERPEGVIIGAIAGIHKDGTPLVVWEGRQDQAPCPALTQIPITPGEINRRCTLTLLKGDPKQPLILGLLHDQRVGATGYRITHAEKALILECGQSRIELRADGHILLRGLAIDTRAYGPCRIMGDTV
jgi:hypothetical protein